MVVQKVVVANLSRASEEGEKISAFVTRVGKVPIIVRTAHEAKRQIAIILKEQNRKSKKVDPAPLTTLCGVVVIRSNSHITQDERELLQYAAQVTHGVTFTIPQIKKPSDHVQGVTAIGRDWQSMQQELQAVLDC